MKKTFFSVSSTILREKRRPILKQVFTHSLLRISVVVVVVVVGVVVVEVGLIGTRGLFRLPEPSAPEPERDFNLPKVCSHSDSALSQCVRYDTHDNAVTTM